MKPELLMALENCENELIEIEDTINHMGKLDKTIKYLQNYAMIRACGTIEDVVKDLIADRVTDGASEMLKKYIDKNVRDSSKNPRASFIADLLGEFSDIWKMKFNEELKHSLSMEKMHLNSMVTERNRFAHGVENVHTGINNIRIYFESSRKIVAKVDEIINI